MNRPEIIIIGTVLILAFAAGYAVRAIIARRQNRRRDQVIGQMSEALRQSATHLEAAVKQNSARKA